MTIFSSKRHVLRRHFEVRTAPPRMGFNRSDALWAHERHARQIEVRNYCGALLGLSFVLRKENVVVRLLARRGLAPPMAKSMNPEEH